MAEIQPNWSQLYSNSGIRFGNNAGLDALNQKYAQFQQQRALDAKDFANVMAKMNFGGVKPADLPDLQKQYGDILQTYSQSRAETDPRKQAALNMELKLKQQQMAYDIANKREVHGQELKAIELLNHPNNYPAEGAAGLWQDVVNTPSGTPEYEKKLQNAHENSYDKPIDIDKVTNGFIKDLTNVKTNTGTPFKDPETGLYVTPKIKNTSLDKDQLTDKISTWLTSLKENQAHRLMDRFGVSTSQDLVSLLSNKAYNAVKDKLGEQITTDKGELSYAQRLAMQENAAKLKLEYPTFGQSQNLTPIYRQDWIHKMLSGAPGSGEALVEKLKADATYTNELGIKVNGNDITFTIPDKRKYDAKTGEYVVDQPSRKVTINKKDPNADVKLNELVNQLTGEKVDISALRTPGGKKHVPDYEHIQKAKDPKTGKIYTLGFKNGKWYNTETNQEYK